MKPILEQSTDELKDNALHAFSATEKLTTRLVQLTNDKGDKDAAQDAVNNARAGQETLSEWYGVDR